MPIDRLDMKKLLSLLLLLCLLFGSCTIEYAPPVEPGTTRPQTDSADFLSVHFVDVGQADCVLLELNGEYMLIDGGNVADSRKVVSYLLGQGVEMLNTVICTHPHEDHAGGLPAVLAVFPTRRILSPTATYASSVFDDLLRYADQQDLTVEIPSPGDSFQLGSGDFPATVTILGPVKSYEEVNDTSIVVRVEYGETSFLFTGDMELTAENDMLEYWDDQELFRTDVLKVGHHGSDTSTGYRFLYQVQPTYAVISVGKNNTYGHPHGKPLSRLDDAGCTIFRTDKLGTVIAQSDGREISFTWERSNSKPDSPKSGTPKIESYIGNTKSGIFHAGDCINIPGEKSREFFQIYEDALDAGYRPCESCLH